MAVTASGLFTGSWKRGLTGAASAFDLDVATGKGFLISNAATPDFTAVSTTYSTLSGNEVSGGSWVVGGIALTGISFDIATTTGTLIFDAADVSQATSTLSNARAYVYYLDANTDNDALWLVDFTTDVSTSNGTFEIIWAAPGSGGIWNIDMTP